MATVRRSPALRTFWRIHRPERESLYQRFMDDIDPSYADYQTQTSRRIPVVALQPEEPA